MEEAKKSDETTRTQALKDMYGKKKQKAQSVAASSESKGTFKIVTDRDDQVSHGSRICSYLSTLLLLIGKPRSCQTLLQLNPDLTHDATKSSAKRMFKVEDMAASGKEWRSPAFDLFDPNHPAVTGQHHPEATPGVGHKNVNTSAIAAARGEGVGVPKQTSNVSAAASGNAAVGGARNTAQTAVSREQASAVDAAGTTNNALGNTAQTATSRV